MLVNPEYYETSKGKLCLKCCDPSEARDVLAAYQRTVKSTQYLSVTGDEVNRITPVAENHLIINWNRDPNKFFIGIYLDSKFIGVVTLERTMLKKECHIGNVGIWIVPEQQGNGFGRIALEYVIRIAKERNIEILKLSVNSKNTYAVELYLSLGFKTYGTFYGAVKLEDGTYDSKNYMALSL